MLDPVKYPVMTIYDMLKNDHRTVLAAIDAIEKTTDPNRRKDLFSFIRTELTMHSKAEEEVLYRPLRERTQNDMLLETSFEDHHAVEELLGDIQATDADDREWLDKVRQLRSLLETHIQKEEGPLFELAKSQFGDEEAERISMRMMEEKGKLGMENPVAVLTRKVKELVAD
jgi:hemerythrin superfamily protein